MIFYFHDSHFIQYNFFIIVIISVFEFVFHKVLCQHFDSVLNFEFDYKIIFNKFLLICAFISFLNFLKNNIDHEVVKFLIKVFEFVIYDLPIFFVIIIKVSFFSSLSKTNLVIHLKYFVVLFVNYRFQNFFNKLINLMKHFMKGDENCVLKLFIFFFKDLIDCLKVH